MIRYGESIWDGIMWKKFKNIVYYVADKLRTLGQVPASLLKWRTDTALISILIGLFLELPICGIECLFFDKINVTRVFTEC